MREFFAMHRQRYGFRHGRWPGGPDFRGDMEVGAADPASGEVSGEPAGPGVGQDFRDDHGGRGGRFGGRGFRGGRDGHSGWQAGGDDFRGGWGRHGGRDPGGFFGRGGHGGRGGGRGGQRMFDHGALRLVVLALIAESPRHGYEIIKAIEEKLAGSYSPSPGVIYPTLTLLQELGYATVEEHDGKKRYSITDEGRRHLADNQAAVDAALARMQEINSRLGGGPAPQIVRALENLKFALRLRLNRGPLTAEQAQAVAEALDAAAHRIDVI